MDHTRIDQSWQSYLATLPADSPRRVETYTAERFGDSPELGDELGKLILWFASLRVV